MMMTHARPDFISFLRKAHRRWIIWRSLERAGLFILGGSAIAVPLIVLLWLRGEPALPGVLAVLAASAAMGFFWGILRRPSLLDTAMEADRQFDLHDLLGTALTLPQCAHADESTRAMISALADEQCRRLAVLQLILNRLGARAWSGVGLTTALVLTLSLMTTAPSPSTAADATDPFAALLADAPSVQMREGVIPQVRRATDRRRPTAHVLDDSSNASSPLPTQGETVNDAPADGSRTLTADGAGGASAQTESTTAHANRPVPLPLADDPLHGDTPAGGSGGAADELSRADDPAAGLSQPRPLQRPPSPWQSATWNDDRSRAMRAIERGEIPDAYRDLVREYFDRDAR